MGMGLMRFFGALVALVAAVPFALAGEAMQASRDVHVLPRDYAEWLRFTPVEDGRPFFVRLLLSLRPWGEVGTDKGKLRVDDQAAEVSGTYRDGERPRGADAVPRAYGVGIAGRAEF